MNGGDLMYNMSKFYIKNNMVINHPTEIEKKKENKNKTWKQRTGKRSKPVIPSLQKQKTDYCGVTEGEENEREKTRKIT